ncbi:hypothetical protein [Reichenbachiella ulvae]|uniref:Uncharacterized protein n=1 Tax=Reichenbachiella ulvae TaxID=2980104 RepID=A0ABT3CUF1_9BACT|nr:hypothetical protein [Reichenbachiella ulvae]MCV9387321.1 hypothetical protein [Reichenbachiella ulvae]
MELRELIYKYYQANSLKEKAELKSKIMKAKEGLNLPLAFEVTVMAHYDAYEMGGVITSIDTMLSFLPEQG